MRLLSRLAIGFVALAATSANAATVYSNDFSSNTDGFTGQTTVVTSPSGEKFLQLYNAPAATGVTTLALNTAGYTGLNLSFNLYGILSVDGNGPFGGGPDPFSIAINGVPTYSINVANFSGDTQNYNGNLATSGAGNSYAPRTGSLTCGTQFCDLGYGQGDFGGSVYNVGFALPNGTSSVTFSGGTNEGVGNEFYGIDNILVTGTANGLVAAVPEPASWAMMIVGFGMIGAAMRRRRRPTVLRYV